MAEAGNLTATTQRTRVYSQGVANFGPHARRKVGLYHVSQYISGGSHTVVPVDTIYKTKPLSDVATQQEGEPLVAV